MLHLHIFTPPACEIVSNSMKLGVESSCTAISHVADTRVVDDLANNAKD